MTIFLYNRAGETIEFKMEDIEQVDFADGSVLITFKDKTWKNFLAWSAIIK